MRALTLATLVGLLATTHGLSTQERKEYAARYNIDQSEVEEHMFTKREVALAKMYMCLPHTRAARTVAPRPGTSRRRRRR